ncbi:four helix bundle protein [Flavobacterium humi]|uniref:Four helix bundle protein n=1 Tax=Flavobacterium humi TaxID=2562683 RepID=A0A4Z0L740_9FLAO|nr:four helix bundle protein [Flavobacterium humi]TGD58103.1 four helix bundle protein [Flavobacterium humi]
MKTFRDLLIWQKAMALTVHTYAVTSNFATEELASEIRKCSIAIPSIIAEGSGSGTGKDFYKSLGMATGALFAFQTQMEIAFNLNYIPEQEFGIVFENSRELERMIGSFRNKIKETL